MALLPHLAKPRFPVLANERVIPAAPTWVGGVHSCSTPEGAHPATRTMKASLSSSPGALLSCVFPSSGLTCTAPTLTWSGRTTGLQPPPPSPNFFFSPRSARSPLLGGGSRHSWPHRICGVFPPLPAPLPVFFRMSEHSSLQENDSLLRLALAFSQMCPF